MPRSSGRRKKRVFCGNQYRARPTAAEDSAKPKPNERARPTMDKEACSSAKKLKIDRNSTDFSDDSYYILIDYKILRTIIERIAKCPLCNSKVGIKNDIGSKQGFSCKLTLKCISCEWSDEVFTSSAAEKSKESPGRAPFDINLRMVYAFREIGRGHKAITKLTTFVNMPPPMSKTSYNKINSQLHKAYTSVSRKCMENAGKEVHEILQQSDEITDCRVSLDGTWQKRGYSSLNGAVTLLSSETGKCLDFQVMSKKCKGCEVWSKRTNHPKYEEWKAAHICKVNHKKSSGAMEGAGAVAIFKRSIDLHSLRYTEYVGDGDSSSFPEVVDAKPYGDGVVIKKKECIGHVQKRVGSRCRTLRQSLKGTKLADGKGIKGKGRLTDKAINTLQNYYGMAIRQNTQHLYGMKKAIGAVLHHCSDIPDESLRHRFRPVTEDSWCKWQSDKINGKSQYKKKVNLPLAIKEVLLPIFKDLSDDELLSKCLHGLTQNANEAINHIIWKKCPKNIYVSRDVLEIAVSSAVIDFNDGQTGLCKVAEEIGLNCGKFMIDGAIKADNERINNITRKSSEIEKKRRKKSRAIREGYDDKEKEAEGGDSYAAGQF